MKHRRKKRAFTPITVSGTYTNIPGVIMNFELPKGYTLKLTSDGVFMFDESGNEYRPEAKQ